MELSSGYSSDLVDKVLNHKLDMAIVSRRDEVDEWILLCKDPMKMCIRDSLRIPPK